ncbi:MAG TPA: hypothetical protein VLC09_21885 [Polyangiaceae bacterium]|nr:hypothetical protein [Polyangiaceae bacterium]
MSSRALPLLLLPIWLAVACSAATEATDSDGQATRQANACSTDLDCEGGVCQDGLCSATSAPYGQLLFEVTPPAGASDTAGTTIAGVRFTQMHEKAEWDAGQLDLELGYVARVRGSILGGEFEGGCVPVSGDAPPFVESDDDSLPARLMLVPRERLLGLGNPLLTAEASWNDGAYRFALDVPPGRYDIYVEPSGPDHGCVRSPYLVVDKEIPAENVDLSVVLPDPKVLTVVARWPHETDDLSGWTMDIVERGAGRLLSNRVVLGTPTQVAGGQEYQATLAFSAVDGDGDVQVDEIVRLSPPAESVAPTVYVQRSVVELFQGGTGLIDQLSDLPEPVRLSGRVSHSGGPKPAPSTVTIVATALSAVSPGTVAAFWRTITTDLDGAFQVDLLPGEYRVLIVPSEAGRAISEQKLIVSGAQSEQKGLTFEVEEQQSLFGTFVDYRGQPVDSALVQASAAPLSGGTSIADLQSGLGGFVARSAAGSTDSSGNFVLLVDRGTFDLVAQPPESSGLPWSFLLGRESTESASFDLHGALPRVVRGTLRSRDIGAVPSALIRAYAYVKGNGLAAQPSEATRLVPVAETRADETGGYRLLLPAQFE